MRGSDKYLIVFAVGVVALVIVALIVAALRPDEAYREGATPEDVAHDYLLAMERGDYERAYAHLSPDLKGYPPDTKRFTQQMNQQSYRFPTIDDSVSLSVISVQEGDDWATANVQMTTYYGAGLFGPDRYSSEFKLQLELVDGIWRITEGDRFFLSCWSSGECN